MEALLSLEAVTSQYNLKALRHLHDQVESQVRGLRALGIAANSYGSLLSPVILKKLPQELRLIVSREVREGRWNLDELMMWKLRPGNVLLTRPMQALTVTVYPRLKARACLLTLHCIQVNPLFLSALTVDNNTPPFHVEW